MIDKNDRAYFRITDHVGLHYRLLTSAEYEAVSIANRFAEVSSIDSLSEIDRQMQIVLARLKIKMPDVAELGTLLDGKIRQLIEHSQLGKDQAKLASCPQLQVDMSASGIAFPSSDPIPKGQMLEMEMVLQPSHQCIKLLAKVLGCEADNRTLSNGDKSLNHVIRTEFVDISEHIQEFLIQYLVKRQASLIKVKRDENRHSDLR